ncbi:hypothetical protein EBR21_06455 [bacterium]|nr:hypothetical protein [bacterium]
MVAWVVAWVFACVVAANMVIGPFVRVNGEPLWLVRFPLSQPACQEKNSMILGFVIGTWSTFGHISAQPKVRLAENRPSFFPHRPAGRPPDPCEERNFAARQQLIRFAEFAASLH